jgi:hypothetical protein
MLEREADQKTKASYNSKILWGFTLFTFGFSIPMVVLMLSASLPLGLFISTAIGVDLWRERSAGLNYLEDLPLYLRTVLKSW